MLAGGGQVWAPPVDAPDLDLVHYLAWTSTYAPYQFECAGYPGPLARTKAKAALGRKFERRFGRVFSAIAAKHSEKATEEATIHVTPGYKLTDELCRQFSTIVPDAYARLRELERRTGGK